MQARWNSGSAACQNTWLETRGVGIEDLGVDPVLVLLAEAGRRVVAAGADVLPPDPRRPLLGRQPDVAVGAEVDGVERALHHPGVALLEALHARRPVRELGRHPVEVHRSGGSLMCESAETNRHSLMLRPP